MKRPEEKIRKALWANVAPEFDRAIEVLLSSKEKKEKKLELARGMVQLAYQGGLDRGYDLGHHVFGDGLDGDEGEEPEIVSRHGRDED